MRRVHRPSRVRWTVLVLVLAWSGHPFLQTVSDPPSPRPLFNFTSLLQPGVVHPADGAADTAVFSSIRDVTFGPDGALYVLDGHAVRRVAPEGGVVTVAGAILEAGAADGVAAHARFRSPEALTVDAGGVIYVADSGNHVLRQISLTGTVSTIAGVSGSSGHANGPARDARLNHPTGLVVTAPGTIYFTERSCLLRRLTTTGDVEAVAGMSGFCAHQDGAGSAARLAGPVALAADTAGVMYIAENNHTVRRVTPGGVVSTLAGQPGVMGTGSATLSAPRDITVTGSGAVRVLESWFVGSTGGAHSINVGQAAIRDVAPDGTLTRLQYLDGRDWGRNGQGLAYGADGRAYWGSESAYSETHSHLRRAAPAGDSSVWVGLAAGRSGIVTGAADTSGVVVLEIADETTYRVRRVGLDGTVGPVLATVAKTTSAGSITSIGVSAGSVYFARSGWVSGTGYMSAVYRLGSGGATETVVTGVLGEATGIAGSATGGLVLSLSQSSHRVVGVSAAGTVTQLAGDTQYGYADGIGTTARFQSPSGLVVSAEGDIYVADRDNHVIRRVTPAGVVTTVAGSPAQSGSVDGPQTNARLQSPTRVALGPGGTLIVQDGSDWAFAPRRALRRVAADGTVDSVAMPSAVPPTGSLWITGIGDGRIIVGRTFDLQLGTAPASSTLVISQQPLSVSTVAGQDVVLTVAASGAPAPSTQWEFSDDAGTTWSQVAIDGTASRLTVRSVTRGMHGRRFRAVVSDADETLMSSAASLVVAGLGADVSAVTLLASAPNQSAAFVAPPQTIVVATTDPQTTWTATADQSWITVSPASGMGTGSITLSVSPVGFTDGQTSFGSIRLSSTSEGSVVIPVELRSLRAPRFATQPRDAIFGETAGFYVRPAGLEFTVLWEESTDNVHWQPAVGRSSVVYSYGEWYLSVTSPIAGTWYRAVATNGAGSTPSDPVRVRRLEMRVDRPNVSFRGWRDDNGVMIFPTLTADVQVAEVSWWTTTWAASSPVPWLTISPASGVGARTIRLTLHPERLPFGEAWSSEATVTATSVLSSPRSDVVGAVTVQVTAPAATSGPFGQVDTPAQSATGVQGSVAVTGWVLDDIGVVGVGIYRDCLPIDAPGSCQPLLGRSLVYIGDATLVPGARPDVAAAYSSYPDASRAGWGFLLLTPMLPHVPSGQPFGGQGPLTIYPIARDLEGRQRLLGRSADPRHPDAGTPTYLTLDNDAIGRPFGAIDTPAQGETVSGMLHNFGWVLTPDLNTVQDATDILMPVDGSTITVYIDGVPRGTVTYGLCRGTFGASVPAGVFCDDDVANVFGRDPPQPTGTSRISNPTRFRNLDNGRAAIGVFSIDTTTLADGLHSIAWGVSDSAGRVEGLGSRFFTVNNSGARALRQAAVAASPPAAEQTVISALPSADGGVWHRSGFDASTPWIATRPDEAGRYHVRIAEADRLELWLGGAISEAWQGTAAALTPIPADASLDGPRFAWAPPPGYLGAYLFHFVRGGERIEVVVLVGGAP